MKRRVNEEQWLPPSGYKQSIVIEVENVKSDVKGSVTTEELKRFVNLLGDGEVHVAISFTAMEEEDGRLIKIMSFYTERKNDTN